jgi:phospholipase C
MKHRSIAALVASAVFTACSSRASVAPVTPNAPATVSSRAAAPPIQHLIILVQEDRSFNDLFAGFPGADSTLHGLTHTGRQVLLKAVSLTAKPCDINGGFSTIFNRGKMDGWDLLDSKNPLCPYTHVKRSDIGLYWNLASDGALDDATFASTFEGDFVDHQYLIAGSTKVAPNTFVVGPPSAGPWGCDAPAGSRTPVLKNGKLDLNGPFPCFTYPTIASLLDAHRVSWRWYAATASSSWNPFAAIKYVREGTDWKRNVSMPETNVFWDLKNGTLADVSWVTPSGTNSDDPQVPNAGGGPAWVASVVDAVKHSKYWSHAAVVVLWNDGGEGQFYDATAPPQLDALGLGLRVALMVVSPHAKAEVSHVQFETAGSTLKFIEENWNLGSLGTTDVRANSVGQLLRE